MTFNEKLIRLRRIKGLTQDEFASAVSVSRQAVYKWESGQSYPEVPKLLLIKELFGISIDDLLDESFEVEMTEIKKKRASKRVRQRAIEQVEAEATAESTEEQTADGVSAVAEEIPAEAVAEQTPVQTPAVEAVEAPAETVSVVAEEIPTEVVAEQAAAQINANETVEAPAQTPIAEVPVQTPAVEVTEAPADVSEQNVAENTETVAQDDKKRGLFSRLFGRR